MRGRERYKTPSLRPYRLLAGKTQREVGNEAGVSGAFVSQLETGRADARPTTIEALAIAVYAELSDLLKEPPTGDLTGLETPAPGQADGAAPIPRVGERVVLVATGQAGEVEDITRCAFTGLTYLRIAPDAFPYPLVQSSLTVRKEAA